MAPKGQSSAHSDFNPAAKENVWNHNICTKYEIMLSCITRAISHV